MSFALAVSEHMANGHVEYLAAGAGDFLSPPDFSNLSGFAPVTKLVVGALGALAVIVGVIMFFVGLIRFAFSGRDPEKHGAAVDTMKTGGIAIVGGIVGYYVITLIIAAAVAVANG